MKEMNASFVMTVTFAILLWDSPQEPKSVFEGQVHRFVPCFFLKARRREDVNDNSTKMVVLFLIKDQDCTAIHPLPNLASFPGSSSSLCCPVLK